MDIVFLAGPIASGKSTVARYLQELGAWRIDLDRVSRAVTAPQKPALAALARVFGEDIVREDGSLNRSLLASRAFASEKATQELEAIELPFIRQALMDALSYAATVVEEPGLVVVEVPLLDRLEDLLPLASEVLVIKSPQSQREVFAAERGMDVKDFAQRQARQPSEAYLQSHATAVLENRGTLEELLRAAKAWYLARGYELMEGEEDTHGFSL